MYKVIYKSAEVVALFYNQSDRVGQKNILL